MAALALVLGGCRAGGAPESAGPVVFFDAAGNRMVVGQNPKPAASDAASEPQPQTPDELTADLGKKDFGGESYVDADDFQRRLDQREAQRFYVVPDGSGSRQMLSAGDIGIGEQPAPAQELPVAGQWRVCRVIVPLLPLKPAQRYDVHFPALDDDKIAHAGYLLAAPEGATRALLRTWIRGGSRAFPVLARVDAEGRVVSIVNNMPTQSIPESTFRYGSVMGTLSLPAAADSKTRYALLDAVTLAGRMPPSCGMPEGGEGISAGLVTLQFSGMGEQ